MDAAAGSGGGGAGGAADGPRDTTTTDGGTSPMMSFFITSRTGDGNLGGLTGADNICQTLATAVGVGGKTWKAYLSTASPMVNARDRIGNGPWHNALGVKISDNLMTLHAAMANGSTPGNLINGENGRDEKGVRVPAGGGMPQQHDILTGTNVDGTVYAGRTCMDWTGAGIAQVGHYDRMGGASMTSASWNSAHENAGCATADLVRMRGGAGRFYCFATTP